MKEKKSSRARKTLLMGVACVLVAAISVSATLAYLTAKTDPKINTFKSKSDTIQGETLEPAYKFTQTGYFSPGDDIDKDPLIHNKSTSDVVAVGARVQFYITVESGADPVQVDYDTFKKYVTVKTAAGSYKNGNVAATINDFNESTKNNSSKWILVDNSSNANVTGVAGYDPKALYFYYNSALASNMSTTSTVNGNAGKYNLNAADTTDPLFTDIHVNEYIWIPTPGSYENSDPKIVQNALTPQEPAENTVYIDSPSDVLTSTTQYNYIFRIFDFEIKVSSYGMDFDGNAGDAVSAKSEDIMKGLAGYDSLSA